MNQITILRGKIRRRIIRYRFGKVEPYSYSKKLCLLIGPESSGTRVITSILSQHPKILGTTEASGHLDVLDDVWLALEDNHLSAALSAFPDMQDYQCVLTRRSMPHARVYGEPAIYMNFTDLFALRKLCVKKKMDLVLFITSRSYIPNLGSWTQNRLSAQRSLVKAELQYQASYRYLFDFIHKSRLPYYMLSLESLILDGQEYVQSLFQILGLENHNVQLDLRPDVNLKYYMSYGKDGGNQTGF